MDNNRQEKMTIDKVAELCGVSKTTVSRFLNGKYTNMSEDTRERIRSVITELDYRPNRTAQRLKAGKSMLIGCVIADAGSPFSAILLRGIAKACEDAGYQVLFADSREDSAVERRMIEGFLESHVDGLIVNTVGGNDEMLVDINSGRLPVVLVDRLIDDDSIPSVSSPNYQTAYKSTRMLYNMGYELVGYVGEEQKKISPRIERRKAYEAACTERGQHPFVLELDPIDSFCCDKFIKNLLAKHPGRRVGLLCGNGVSCQQVLLAMNRMNIISGYDFGLCTFDDWDWLQLAKPGITSIQMGTEEKGIATAKLLVERINSASAGDVKHIEIPTRTILRNSTTSTP